MSRVAAYVPIKLNNSRTPGKNTKPFSDGSCVRKRRIAASRREAAA